MAERRLDGVRAGWLTPIKADLQTLLRLLRAYGEGEYREVSGKNLALAGLGLLYLVSPLDVLPDFLPGGFADDAAVIGFVLGSSAASWRRSKRGSGDGPTATRKGCGRGSGG